jgi:thioester reductase-like protein
VFPPDDAGYSRSKAVAEAYFERAAELDASVSIVRLPNIFGDRRAFQLNPADTVWSWTRAIITTGRYPGSYDTAGNELFQALPADVTARIVVRLARPHDTPGCRIINATPNLACTSRNFIAGLREAGYDITPLADRQWYELVSTLDPGEIWVAGSGSARRLHRFLLDEEPVISNEVNTHAIWTPKDVAAYAASLAIN